MIEIYSFEEWDALQDPEKTVEWGSSTNGINSPIIQESCLYKEAPIEIKRMFYSEYIHKATAPAMRDMKEFRDDLIKNRESIRKDSIDCYDRD
jgi:hypothetical protein